MPLDGNKEWTMTFTADKASLQEVTGIEDFDEEDVVNHPAHYADTCSLECIDVMQLMFGEDAVIKFCLCNAFKYMWRYKHKNGEEDLNKAGWYLDKVRELTGSSEGLEQLTDLLIKLRKE